ncbi:MAG: hypothetical protein K6A43_12280 [Treponema sp.]|nr:hypothetical protein [Treponema sp.]
MVPQFKNIAKYTVGNKEYFGKFVEKKSYAPIKQVLVQGTRKTGSTLSAIPYITDSENPTENDKFAGEIESFQWYRGESSEDGQIEWTPISLQTGETYKLTPADVGKNIKVELKQKFTAQLDEEKGIYVINQTGESVSSNQTAASGLVQKGSLNQETLTDLFSNEDFELTYNNNNPVLIGSLLDEDKISASSNTLTIEDENNNPVAISFAFNLEQKTPENGSNYVPFVVKADGYSDVPVSAVQKLLFVYVKANVLS